MIPLKTGPHIRKFLLGTAAASLLAAFSQQATAAELGDVDDAIKLAVNEWTGQHITTHIGGSLLEKAGYTVEYITAGNYPQHAALADGDVHATLEVWDNNAGDIYPKMKDAGKIVDIGNTGLATNEGWMYPKHMEELCPGLPAWEALKDCKDVLATAETFPQGRILSYPADWGTRSADIITGLGIDYKAVPAGSEGALVAELTAADAAKKPLVMMFWAPHWVFSIVDVGWVELPKYDPACSTEASWGPNPDEINDCGVNLPLTIKVAWAGFQEKWPAAWDLLALFTMDTGQQEAMMNAIDNNGEKLEDVIAAWVADNEATWKPWVEAATAN
jgi:glycine betaine/proline transport system substrate-binding protein